MGVGYAPHVVLSLRELADAVEYIRSVGAFAFDVETRGNIVNHPDLEIHMVAEWKEHLATLKNPSPEIANRARENFENNYKKLIALDPLRNEVFWIGLATRGKSWAIPMGHKRGLVTKPEEVGDGSTVPPPGYRKILKNGQESLAKAKYIIPAEYSEPPKQLSKSEVFSALQELFFDEGIVKVGHNVKFDARSISKYYGSVPPGPYADTMLMQHIVNENLMSYSLEQVIGANYDKHDAYYRDGKLGKVIDDVPFDKAINYVHTDVRWTWLLYTRLLEKISRNSGLQKCFYQDNKVLEILMEMENTGIPVNESQLIVLGKELDDKLNDILLRLSDHTPIGFNPDSTKHKQALLFTGKRQGGLALKPYKETSTGQPSVDEESLRHLEHKHPAISMLLEWAETKKLKSTYVAGLLPKLNKSSLHPSFHLHRTTTGRLSSSDPNLQNIPRESSIRNLFVAPEGYSMLVADYDQIELRVMAMFSQDPQLVHVFANDIDIHAGAAALLFGKPVEEVTSDERQIGKGVNFLTAYGGGAGKLARTTGIEFDHAQEIIDRYYRQFAGLTQWKRDVVNSGRKYGYVETITGRRRRLPDLKSVNTERKARAERQAVNAVVQGSAADICKQAMIDIHTAFKDKDLKMLVQVHDELVAIAPIELAHDYRSLFMEAMGHGRVIDGIPLRVSCHIAHTWAEAKGK